MNICFISNYPCVTVGEDNKMENQQTQPTQNMGMFGRRIGRLGYFLGAVYINPNCSRINFTSY